MFYDYYETISEEKENCFFYSGISRIIFYDYYETISERNKLRLDQC